MKAAKTLGALLLITGIAYLLVHHDRLSASESKQSESNSLRTFEYATIRWDGRDNTHLIRSNGKVEFLTSVLSRVNRPDRTDERAFYMNVAMNAAAREGYEFVGMCDDRIVMRRAVAY